MSVPSGGATPDGTLHDVDTLQGRLLLAGPQLLDPNFERTVVLVGDHGEEGAMGVVLNRPSDVRVRDAAPDLGVLADADDVLYVGGPVEQQAIVVLADFVQPERAGVLVHGSVGFVPGALDQPEALGELRACRVFAGYAGWSPGQLEAELDEGSWVVADVGPGDVFTTDSAGLWARILRRRGGHDAILALFPGDPRVN